jgi:hypothetical protein
MKISLCACTSDTCCLKQLFLLTCTLGNAFCIASSRFGGIQPRHWHRMVDESSTLTLKQTILETSPDPELLHKQPRLFASGICTHSAKL